MIANLNENAGQFLIYQVTFTVCIGSHHKVNCAGVEGTANTFFIVQENQPGIHLFGNVRTL